MTAENKDKAARAAERRAKDKKADGACTSSRSPSSHGALADSLLNVLAANVLAAAAALVESKPLKPTVSSTSLGSTGDKKLKPKPKSRSSASKIPIIPDSSDDDLPLVVGASDSGAPSTAAAAGMAKKRDAEVLMVSSGTESDDVRAVKPKKKKMREVSPEL